MHVFGKEYFFGGGFGIASMSPEHVTEQFGISVHSVVSMGQTDKTFAEFATYLGEINPRYTGNKYHLLQHNCNNFSDEIVRWLRGDGVGIPEHITELPNLVMQSPLAQAILLPALEGMHELMNTVPVSKELSLDDLVTRYGHSSVEFFRNKAEANSDDLVTFHHIMVNAGAPPKDTDLEHHKVTHILDLTGAQGWNQRNLEIFSVVPDGGEDEVEVEEFFEVATTFLQDVKQQVRVGALIRANGFRYLL